MKREIYVLCPAAFATGGPEALHTLCLELRNQGQDAKMLYLNAREGQDPVAPRYRVYGLPYVTHAEDREGMTVVVSEIDTYVLKKFPRARKAIWWLSVDNYFPKLQYFGPRSLADFLRREFGRFRDFGDPSVLHLCQSHYALDFVRRKGVRNALLVMDYLGEEHLRGRFETSGREDVVLYNPSKGRPFTEKIMKALEGEVRFVALRGLTAAEVHDWCARAKVYIDFGHHPGKDRFPREAAMAGCVVVTSRRGSAAFHEDVPIPDAYKFVDADENVAAIAAKIRDVLANYERRVDDFAGYRDFIREDRPRFVRQVRDLVARMG